MSAGSLTAAALRHRPGQALPVVALAAVVSASAVLGPLYSRAVEPSVLRSVLGEALSSERGVVVAASSSRPPSPARCRGAGLRVRGGDRCTPPRGRVGPAAGPRRRGGRRAAAARAGDLVVVGTGAGAGLGWVVARLATSRWLAAGVALEWHWPGRRRRPRRHHRWPARRDAHRRADAAPAAGVAAAPRPAAPRPCRWVWWKVPWWRRQQRASSRCSPAARPAARPASPG